MIINKNQWESVQYKKGEIIFKQNSLSSDILFLDTGLVKIYKEFRSNKNMILRLISGNKFLNIFSYLNCKTHNFSASALENSIVYSIPKNDFSLIMENNNSFVINLMKNSFDISLQMTERLLYNQQKQLPGRLASILLHLSTEIYSSNSFTLPLTRKEMSEYIGTSRESLIRTLSEFKNDRIIEMSDDGKKVTIKSIELIRKLSEIG